MPGGASAGTAFIDFQADLSTLNRQVSTAMAPGKLGRIGKVGGAALVGGLAVAGIGKALFDIGKKFDDATDQIRVGTGATGKRLAGLKEDLKGAYATVPNDLSEVATAVTKLNQRLHLSGKPLQDLARQELNLSRITKTDLGENIDATSRLFGDWGAQIKSPSDAMDRLFRLTQKTGAPLSDLSQLMVQFGSPLRQLGFDFDNAAAMFGKFEAEGVNLQTIMPGFRFALKNLSAPTGEAADMMSKLGISTKEPAQALREIFADIKKAPTDLRANAIAFAIFGRRAGPDMAAAIREGRFSVQDLLNTMRGGHDTINQAAKDTNDFSENWEIFKHQLEVAVEPVATRFFNTVNRGMSRLVEIMGDPKLDFGEKLGKIFSEAAGEAAKAAPKVAWAFVKAFVNADVWGKLAIAGILTRVIGGKGVFGTLGKRFATALIEAMAGTRIGEAILGMLPTPAAMTTAGTARGRALGKGIVIGIPEGLALGAAALVALFDQWIAEKLGGKRLLNVDFRIRPTWVTGGVSDFLQQGKFFFTEVGGAIKQHIQNWNQQFERLPQIVGNAFRKIGGAVSGNLAGPLQKANQLFGSLRSAAVDSFNSIRGPITSVAKAVKTAIMWIVRAVAKAIRILGNLKGAIPDVSLPSLPSAGDVLGGAKDVLGFQTGVMVPGSGSGDKVPALLEPGEVVVNRTAVRAMGGQGRVNAINQLIPRFAGGGMIPPITLGGSGTVRDIGQGGIDTTRGGANLLLRALKRAGGGPKVQRMIRFAQQIASKHFPYVYGGGHGSFSGPYDCSGFVSAILHAAGLLSSPITTDGLKTYGDPGPGRQVTIGVRGTTGANAHTMMRVGSHFFESGSGHGAAEDPGWSGGFPIKRHPPGLQKGGIIGRAAEAILNQKRKKGLGTLDLLDPRSPNFVGWGLQQGGILGRVLNKNALTTLGRFVHMPREVIMAAIAMAESHGDRTAVGDSGESFSAWQVHHPDWPQYDIGRLQSDWVYGANAAKRIEGSGLSNWSTYNSGAYRQFLGGQVIPSLLQQLRGKGPVGKTKKRKGLKAGDFDISALPISQTAKSILAKALNTQIPGLTSTADIYAEFADRASTLEGLVGGMGEADWLQQELAILFQLREKLALVYTVLAQAIAKINAQLAEWNKRLHEMPAGAAKVDLKKRRDALAAKVSPISSKLSEITESLTDVQGTPIGIDPHKVLGALPAVGVLGGRIFDVQSGLNDAGISTTAEAGSTEREEDLRKLLREANLRTAVSEAGFETLRNLPSFAGGGVVPGPLGQPMVAVVHGRERIYDPREGGEGLAIGVHVHGDIHSDRRDPVEVVVNDSRFQAAVRRVPMRSGSRI
jgi:TP901 family phage tail tape measure protein